MPNLPRDPALSGVLDRAEYVEQAYFFKTLLERIGDNIPMQDVMASIRHELLATTNLPLAIDFLLSELRHAGGMGSAMVRLQHYFTPFQSFVIQQAEDERGRFDFRVAMAVLRTEAEYRASDRLSPQGIFLYQFETLSRNRLSYDGGLGAMATDPLFDTAWRDWILTVRRQIGLIDLAELVYVRSAYYTQRSRSKRPTTPAAVLFGEKEGKIALANRRKDPLLLFAALQRHLGYPVVPRPIPPDATPQLLPRLIRRLERLETRLKLLEDEQRGGIDLSQFYKREPPKPPASAS